MVDPGLRLRDVAIECRGRIRLPLRDKIAIHCNQDRQDRADRHPRAQHVSSPAQNAPAVVQYQSIRTQACINCASFAKPWKIWLLAVTIMESRQAPGCKLISADG